MSKAILEFDLSNPDERIDFDAAVVASKLVNAIWEFDNALRSIHKYDEKADEELTAEKVRDMLHEELGARGLTSLIWS